MYKSANEEISIGTTLLLITLEFLLYWSIVYETDQKTKNASNFKKCYDIL